MRCVVWVVAMMVAAAGSVLTFAAHPATAHDEPHDGKGMKISPTRDLTLPTSWAGEWRITTTYRRATGSLWAVDDVTGVLRAGEPLGLSALTRGGLAECAGTVTDHQLEAACWRRVEDSACQVTAIADVTIERDGHLLAGWGTTKTSVAGNCGDLPGGQSQTPFELGGIRLSEDQGPPGQVLPPLLIRFVRSVPFLTLALTLPQVRPVIEEDCKEDRWRGFTSPAFKNQGQCIKFVHEQVRR